MYMYIHFYTSPIECTLCKKNECNQLRDVTISSPPEKQNR